MPKRIQRKRTKGWKMPPNTRYVGRPGPYGNPFKGPTAEFAVALYRDSLRHRPGFSAAARIDLAGQDLACWCSLDRPCHADVLLEIANG